MNKRIKKKRKDACKLEELEKEHYELERAYNWAMMDLDTCKNDLRNLRSRPTLCSHSIEQNYYSPIGLETHHLQVNAPLRIDHMGPLTDYDVHRLAGTLATALQEEAIAQLMPHAKVIPFAFPPMAKFH